MRPTQTIPFRTIASHTLASLGVALALSLPTAARAVEKYRTVVLPDAGHGSAARAVAAAQGRRLVAGNYIGTDGTASAALWVAAGDVNGDGDVDPIDLVVLPQPADKGGDATGIALLAGNPDRPFICGFIGTDATGTLAALWSRDAAGQFTLRLLDSKVSRANSITVWPDGSAAVCGWYRLSDGRRHARLWRISPSGSIVRTDLSTLGGPNSEALAIGGDRTNIIIAGSAQLADGRWIASYMEEEGIYFVSHPLPTPDGSQSRVRAISVWDDTDITYLSGDVTTKAGQTKPAVWQLMPDGSSNTIMFGLLPGRKHGSVCGITFQGTSGNDKLVVGTSWNSETDRSGFGALSRGKSPGKPFDFGMLSVSGQGAGDPVPTESISFNFAAATGEIAGQGRVNGSSTSQAMVLLPSRYEVPQIIAVLIGLLLPVKDTTTIWQQDARMTRIAPQVTDGQAYLSYELKDILISSYQLTSRAPATLSLTGRVDAGAATSLLSWTVVMQLYDPTARKWVEVGNGILDSRAAFQTLTVGVANPERFAVAGGGALKCRMQVRGPAADSAVLQIDEFQMTTKALR